MDFRADISFEYDYIRIVYEVILANLRTNKKSVEKDLNTIVLRLQNLKKKHSSSNNPSETLTGVKNLIQKVNDLEARVNIFNLNLINFPPNIYLLYSTKKFAEKKRFFMKVSKKESVNSE